MRHVSHHIFIQRLTIVLMREQFVRPTGHRRGFQDRMGTAAHQQAEG